VLAQLIPSPFVAPDQKSGFLLIAGDHAHTIVISIRCAFDSNSGADTYKRAVTQLAVERPQSSVAGYIISPSLPDSSVQDTPRQSTEPCRSRTRGCLRSRIKQAGEARVMGCTSG
jgi:hypothetical protein